MERFSLNATRTGWFVEEEPMGATGTARQRVGVAVSGRAAVVTRPAQAKAVAATAVGAKMRAAAPAAVRGKVKKGVVEALPTAGLRPLD